MLNSLALLTIEIGLDPEIQDFGGLLLTWHGVFTAVGIAAGVWLAVILGRRRGFLEDDIYSAALIAIPFGIIGARSRVSTAIGFTRLPSSCGMMVALSVQK